MRRTDTTDRSITVPVSSVFDTKTKRSFPDFLSKSIWLPDPYDKEFHLTFADETVRPMYVDKASLADFEELMSHVHWTFKNPI